MSATGPLNQLWSAVGEGLHLLSLAYAGTVAHDSLAGMTDSTVTPDTAEPQVRDLAEIPAVEVITRAAVMLMSAAAEKIGLSAAEPDESPHRDLDEARRLIRAAACLSPPDRPLSRSIRCAISPTAPRASRALPSPLRRRRPGRT